MLKIDKPWGYEVLIQVGDDYAFKKLVMRQDQACSLQYHQKKHETIYVVSGELKLEIGDDPDALMTHVLGPGDYWIINPGTIHRMFAIVETVYLEASTPELDDVVRIKDLYGRVEPKGTDEL